MDRIVELLYNTPEGIEVNSNLVSISDDKLMLSDKLRTLFDTVKGNLSEYDLKHITSLSSIYLGKVNTNNPSELRAYISLQGYDSSSLRNLSASELLKIIFSQKSGQISIYDELKDLFYTDPRLKKTIPTQVYELDPVKLEQWKSLVDPRLAANFNYIKISFDQWLHYLAEVFKQLLDMNCGFIVSTGLIKGEDKSQSASELWLEYIFKMFMSKKGYRFKPYDKYWYIAEKPGTVQTDVLFLDDLIRSGVHITSRIIYTPGLDNFLTPETKIILAAPIVPTLDSFTRIFSDVAGEVLSSDKVQDILDRISIVSGYTIDLSVYSNILLDHNSGEKYDSDLFYGYIGRRDVNDSRIGVYIGSLIKGADPLSIYRYPPPLYHIEFGSGELPKNTYELQPIPNMEGYYTSI